MLQTIFNKAVCKVIICYWSVSLLPHFSLLLQLLPACSLQRELFWAGQSWARSEPIAAAVFCSSGDLAATGELEALSASIFFTSLDLMAAAAAAAMRIISLTCFEKRMHKLRHVQHMKNIIEEMEIANLQLRRETYLFFRNSLKDLNTPTIEDGKLSPSSRGSSVWSRCWHCFASQTSKDKETRISCQPEMKLRLAKEESS